MKRTSVFLMGLTLAALVLSSGAGLHARTASVRTEWPPISITILYDNYPFQKGLKTGHGFSCLIQGTEKAVLFDTGADAEALFQNFAALKLDPAHVDLVVISHTHGDHTGGLLPFFSGALRAVAAAAVADLEGNMVPMREAPHLFFQVTLEAQILKVRF